MNILVRTNEFMKEELLKQGVSDTARIHWVSDWSVHEQADAVIDLLFQSGDLEALKKNSSPVIFINAVNTTLKDMPENFIRINGWPTFLQRTVLEASCNNSRLMADAIPIIGVFNKSIEWVADLPGFISARVVAMIINEAFYALDENVSTREEIDIAMRLGTNYPYGPFEWSKLIGIEKIHELLEVLSRGNSRFQPSHALKKEAGQ